MNTPYLVWRRPDARDLPKSCVPAPDCRAGNGSGTVRPLAVGWAMATFAAGAVFGWAIFERKRK